MEKERKITAPEGCEIKKVEIVDGVAVVTFREKERKLPKSFEEFCAEFPKKADEYYVDSNSQVTYATGCARCGVRDKNLLPDRSTAEAVLALCQLIQLRNCYNGDWVPDWTDESYKFIIGFSNGQIETWITQDTASVLYFGSDELRDKFLRYFRPLIEKLKPLYGIKEGGGEC